MSEELKPGVDRPWGLPDYGSRAHINAVAAFLVSRCQVAVESAGHLAHELVWQAGRRAATAGPETPSVSHEAQPLSSILSRLEVEKMARVIGERCVGAHDIAQALHSFILGEGE